MSPITPLGIADQDPAWAVAASSIEKAVAHAGAYVDALIAQITPNLSAATNMSKLLVADGSEVDNATDLSEIMAAAPKGAVLDFGGPENTYYWGSVVPRNDLTFIANGAHFKHIPGTNNAMFYHTKFESILERCYWIGHFNFEGYGWATNQEEKIKSAIWLSKCKDIALVGPRAKNFLSAAFHVQLGSDVLMDDLSAVDCGFPGGRNAIEFLGEESEPESTELTHDAILNNCRADCAGAYHGGAGGVALVGKKAHNLRSTMANCRAYNCMNFAGLDVEGGCSRWTHVFSNKSFCCKEGLQNADTGVYFPEERVMDHMVIALNVTDCKNVTGRPAVNATIEVLPGADMPGSEGIVSNSSHATVVANIARSTAVAFSIYQIKGSGAKIDNLSTIIGHNTATLCNKDEANRPFGYNIAECTDVTIDGNHLDVEAGSFTKDAYYVHNCAGVNWGTNSSRGAGRHAVKFDGSKVVTALGGEHLDPCANEGQGAIEILANCSDIHIGGGMRLHDTREVPKMQYGVDNLALVGARVTTGELEILGYTVAPYRGAGLIVAQRSLFVGVTTPPTFGAPGFRFGYGAAAPTEGAWTKGDYIQNTAPTGTTPTLGWICTATGTPGTWVAVIAK